MTEDGLGRQFWRTYRQSWGWRDVLAYPLVYFLTMIVTVALFGWEWTIDRWIVIILVSAVAWPVALWVVDHTVRRPPRA